MKKVKFSLAFVLFFISFIFHFTYNAFKNPLFSILFPVNESIFEHMKLIATSIFFVSGIEYIILKKLSFNENNFLISKSISAILGIIIYLLIYLPLNSLFGHKMWISITLLFIVFILIIIIQYYIEKKQQIKYSNFIGIILIISIYIIFTIFTYYPPNTRLFYDTENKTYGIIKK